MPTGFTSLMYENKPQTFREFAMSCARNFGAFVMVRDSPLSEEVPQSFAPSTYNAEAAERARLELAEVEGMTADEATAAARRECDAQVAQREEWAKGRRELRNRYEAMLIQARRWEPPTSAHQGVKDFMIQQLEESIKFDCADYAQEPPILYGGDQWRERRVASLRRSIAESETRQLEENARCASRNLWIKHLIDSLAPPVGVTEEN